MAGSEQGKFMTGQTPEQWPLAGALASEAIKAAQASSAVIMEMLRQWEEIQVLDKAHGKPASAGDL